MAISRHLGDFPRPFGAFFLKIYLLLGAFGAKFLFTGGDFFLELIYCWAIFHSNYRIRESDALR